VIVPQIGLTGSTSLTTGSDIWLSRPCPHRELCITRATETGVSPHCFQVRIIRSSRFFLLTCAVCIRRSSPARSIVLLASGFMLVSWAAVITFCRILLWTVIYDSGFLSSLCCDDDVNWCVMTYLTWHDIVSLTMTVDYQLKLFDYQSKLFYFALTLISEFFAQIGL